MKAVVCSKFSSIDDLQYGDVEPPKLGPGQVLIEVRACGVNFPDILMVQGKYQVLPDLPFCPGGEVAGIVTAVAEGVSRVAVGQKVMATIFWGGMAELAVASEFSIVPIPDGMDFLTASVFQGGHTSAYFALKQRGQLQAGEILLVLGAAGGIGLASVQLGKAMGARVIAAASSDEKCRAAQANGADEVINYSEVSLKDRVKELCDDRGADVIIDPVGGDLFDLATRCVNYNGRILVVGFASGRIPKYAINLALLKNCALIGVNYQAFFTKERAHVEENFSELMEMYRLGQIEPKIDKEFSLQEGASALNYVYKRKAIGKVVVSVCK